VAAGSISLPGYNLLYTAIYSSTRFPAATNIVSTPSFTYCFRIVVPGNVSPAAGLILVIVYPISFISADLF
jgi:hypothetical protein